MEITQQKLFLVGYWAFLLIGAIGFIIILATWEETTTLAKLKDGILNIFYLALGGYFYTQYRNETPQTGSFEDLQTYEEIKEIIDNGKRQERQEKGKKASKEQE